MSRVWCILFLGGWLAWSGGAAGPGAVIRIDLGTIDHGKCSATLTSVHGHESARPCGPAGSGAPAVSQQGSRLLLLPSRHPRAHPVPQGRQAPGAALNPQQELLLCDLRPLSSNHYPGTAEIAGNPNLQQRSLVIRIYNTRSTLMVPGCAGMGIC